MLRTELYADPHNQFLHDLILESCHRNATKTAIVDTSCGRRLTFSEYAEIVESAARGFIAAGVKPGDVVAIFLPNSWEFCVAFHASQLAGAIPTLLNPTYREREVRYQLENSGAVVLITDCANINGIDLGGLHSLRRVYTTRKPAAGAEPFANLLSPASSSFPKSQQSSQQALAALPYSSGTTGLPKGVMSPWASAAQPGIMRDRFFNATGFEIPSQTVVLSRSRSAKEYVDGSVLRR